MKNFNSQPAWIHNKVLVPNKNPEQGIRVRQRNLGIDTFSRLHNNSMSSPACNKCNSTGEILERCSSCGGAGGKSLTPQACHPCGGVGRMPYDKSLSCATCKGTGRISDWEQCWLCKGAKIIKVWCKKCRV